LGRNFDALIQQLTFAKWKWGEYVTLFGTSEKRIELLNSAAPQFFNLLDGVMWEDILLHIARLTDSPTSAGRGNLSIRSLPALIDDAALRETVSEMLCHVVNASKFARDWRNRHIAHRDLNRALDGGSAEPLAFASRASVNATFDTMESVMNVVQMHFFNSEHRYELLISRGGALTLLHTLYFGTEVMKDRQRRLGRGEWDWKKDRLPDL
jgi:hypothetical protein